jgi:hypothetical protein
MDGGIPGHLTAGRIGGDNRFGVTVHSVESWGVINAHARLPRIHRFPETRIQDILSKYLFVDRPAGNINPYPRFFYLNFSTIHGDNAIFDDDDEEDDDQGQPLFRFDLDNEANVRLARQIQRRNNTGRIPFCIVIQIMREYYRQNPTRGIPPNAPPEFDPTYEWNHDPIHEWDGQSEFYVNY